MWVSSERQWGLGIRIAGALLLLMLGGPGAVSAPAPHPEQVDLLIATTTTVSESGLLAALIAGFQAQTGYRVTALTGSAAALNALADQGRVDALLVNVPADAPGGPVVLYDDFVLLGPAADPAHLAGQPLLAALRTIAATGTTWVSRHDGSAANRFELARWDAALGRDVQHEGWYVSTHQGGTATLRETARRHAYTLSDGATYRAARPPELQPLIIGDPLLLNPYTVQGTQRNAAGAQAWASYLVSPTGQGIIAAFGRAQYGQALFRPAIGVGAAQSAP
ncbi:MAG: tungsten ABC transporter substrate-binding protein [Chloroflexota bacterium]|nr:tungsten ABC transporter substrate-binding protein [Chloroflexota bacterium]